MQFIDRFLHFIAENKLFTKDQSVLLAVSGGKDSVLMVNLFAEAGFKFGIAHCNFQLRGKDSDLDEVFVKDLAFQFKVSFYSTRFSTDQYASNNQLSTQMAARELRYQWLEEIRAKNHYSYLAVAHHQTDSVETVLLNLLRGTGIAGLSGILPKRNNIIRPLLAYTGEEVKNRVVERKIAYREDLSNASAKYKRNKIRLEVLPTLREINPDLEKTFFANSERFQAVESFLRKAVEEVRVGLFKKSIDNEVQIPLSELQELKPANLWLYELFSPYGFTEAVLSDLQRDWDKGSGRRFLSSTHQIVVDRDKLILKPLIVEKQEPVMIAEFPMEINWFNKRYKVFKAERNELDFAKFTQLVDADMLKVPLLVRSWQEGDRFRPLGMKGQKKLSDFLISLKIPVTEKREVPIIEDVSKSIVAVLPWRIDDRFKVTAKTKKVIIFEELKNE